MECPKCKGLMMLERFSDFFLIFYAWKCINCGAIIDRTISNNRRKASRPAMHSRCNPRNLQPLRAILAARVQARARGRAHDSAASLLPDTSRLPCPLTVQNYSQPHAQRQNASNAFLRISWGTALSQV